MIPFSPRLSFSPFHFFVDLFKRYSLFKIICEERRNSFVMFIQDHSDDIYTISFVSPLVNTYHLNDLVLWGSFAKETYAFREPTNCLQLIISSSLVFPLVR